MSEQKNPAAGTAIVKAKTLDETIAALQVNERTSTGRDDHSGPKEYGMPAWIGYRGNKAKSRLDELNAAGVPENAYYLYDKGVIVPKPFYIHLVTSFHFYSTVDDDNNITAASRVLNDARKKEGFSDHIIGAALVRLPGSTPMFMAATFSQRKAMTRSFDHIRSVLEKFEKDKQGREFKARGEKHREAFEAAKWPLFAVRAKIWGKLEASTRPGGRDYNLGLGTVEPTPVEDVKALNRYMGFEPESYGGEFKKYTELQLVLDSFQDRKDDVIKMLDEQDKNAVDDAEIVNTTATVVSPPPAPPKKK